MGLNRQRGSQDKVVHALMPSLEGLVAPCP